MDVKVGGMSDQLPVTIEYMSPVYGSLLLARLVNQQTSQWKDRGLDCFVSRCSFVIKASRPLPKAIITFSHTHCYPSASSQAVQEVDTALESVPDTCPGIRCLVLDTGTKPLKFLITTEVTLAFSQMVAG